MSDDPVKVLYIAGAGRSGSTLLECMLGELPGIFAAGEVTHIWRRGFVRNELCGCGQPFRDCPFWQDVRRAAFADEGEPDYDEVAALRSSICTMANIPRIAMPRLRTGRFRKQVERYTELLRRLYCALREVSGARVIVDSSKYPPEAFLLKSMDGIDLSVVHLVRNSNAVAYAWQKRMVRPDVHWTTAYMNQHHFLKTAVAWNAFNVLISSLKSERVPYRLIRYEDVIERPRDAVQNIVSLLDIGQPDLDFIEPDAVVLTGNHTGSGNPSRFNTGRVSLSLDLEWRKRAPAAQRALVSLVTLPLQWKYGYLAKGKEAGE